MPPGPGARKSSSRKRKNTSEETSPDKKAKRVATVEEPEAQRQLSRLQRIITGEKSKAALMKRAVRNPAKAKKQTSSRLTGKLTLMLQIPVDVFCEIAAHLSPLDLLHMARSTRPLRDMLMSKRSRPVWRSALGELNTPDCPPEISEPRFMSLIFERFCYGCGAPCTNKVDYGFRVRLCRGCFNLNVVFGSKLVKELNHKASKNDVIYGLCCSYKGDALRQYLSYDSGSDDQRSFLEDRKRIVKETNAHAIEVANWLSLKKKSDGQKFVQENR
ncbi:hypothetical protein DFH11DRAFT_303265 [Phellopilus nigrolimitatus]|nr:hypothetical protein DFH11DRAFT_303265 [Phellopilus nigrolimitatus]